MRWPISEPTLRTDPAASPGVCATATAGSSSGDPAHAGDSSRRESEAARDRAGRGACRSFSGLGRADSGSGGGRRPRRTYPRWLIVTARAGPVVLRQGLRPVSCFRVVGETRDAEGRAAPPVESSSYRSSRSDDPFRRWPLRKPAVSGRRLAGTAGQCSVVGDSESGRALSGRGGRHLVAEEFQQVVGGCDQPPFGAAR